ncbi:haloacid dehalogenase-like hydrolase [Empedobacter falsenii]|uniref:haloacid dehalogenase-like hydrolase n=1 Tax=Empedobacter falsenii TaxID=343874 RepID=UPI002575F26C|nr:haloacid dehalogenase-like hydrolase [Empedobacter falsenii]MDM1297856.1 haloacid dehalogenase-like hydrolase [Empedobacter falsenii]MDM1317516.1 haloacid dehalogenase-like hydrolase [Empedobacter falsenii]
MDKKAVFDFDQTLIRVNSFTKWVAFLLSKSFKNGDYKLFYKVSILIFRRKIIKTLSHQNLKKTLIELDLKQDYYELFVIKLAEFINQEVLNQLIELNQNNYKIAISSAAPEKYLKEFVEKYISINEILVIGTIVENNVLNDNFGERKVVNLVKKGFLNPKEEFEILFTDSFDDFPLAELVKEIHLISPDEVSKNKYEQTFPEKLTL